MLHRIFWTNFLFELPDHLFFLPDVVSSFSILNSILNVERQQKLQRSSGHVVLLGSARIKKASFFSLKRIWLSWKSWNEVTFDQRPLKSYHLNMVLFLDHGEGPDHNALVFCPEKPRKSWNIATMKPRSSHPLRKVEKATKSHRQGTRTSLKKDL